MENPITKFKEDGLYRLQYPAELRTAVTEALAAWKQFVELPDSVTDTFPYGQGVGYEHKLGGGATDDTKKDFHFTFDGADYLHEATYKATAPGLKPVAEELLKRSAYLVGRLSPVVAKFAYDIETGFGMKDFMNEVQASQGSWFVRYLYYPGNRVVGESTAVSHIDKSAFTFHLYESDPGLQALSYGSKEWFDTPVSETETVIFPGFQLQHKTGSEIKALCHRVVANEKTAKHGRYSMVVFFSLKNTQKYDKSQGRLQDFEPGFNYDLSADEVGKRFL